MEIARTKESTWPIPFITRSLCKETKKLSKISRTEVGKLALFRGFGPFFSTTKAKKDETKCLFYL